MTFIKKIFKKIKPKTQQEIEYEYLSQSKDLVDLERRQRLLMRENSNLKGWV